MFYRRSISFIALFCCFFSSHGENFKKQSISEKLGKPIFVYLETTDFIRSEQFTYTTDLSRTLLVGEHPVFQRIRCLPLISNLINPVISLTTPIFDNRFENFINNAKNFSQEQLQEAIKDAILLSQYEYNTKSYSASKLLKYLDKFLQNKITYIKDQIKHDFRWDQKALSSMKKTSAWAIGLTTLVVITNKYIDISNIENKVSDLENINTLAILGLIPVSYKVLKNCYKIMTIDPNDCNNNLNKYEELLAFVQKLKAQLEINGFITFKLTNGLTATLKNDVLIFN